MMASATLAQGTDWNVTERIQSDAAEIQKEKTEIEDDTGKENGNAGGNEPVVEAASLDEVQSTEDKDSKDKALSSFEKKQRRAERFGVELQMSEDEKREIRASRFGGKKSAASSVSESAKRNARAARFGINKASEEEASKRKARLTRFASEDTNEEAEKKKARAERFATKSEKKLQAAQPTAA